MCRLFAGIATEVHSWREELMAFSWLASHGLRAPHTDGWGIGWYPSVGSPVIVKEPKSAVENELFEKTATKAISRALIAHVRKASCGANTRENSQPFFDDRFVFAHNGELDYERAKSLLANEYFSKIKGQSDSELYCLLLSQEINKAKDVLAGIRASVSRILSSGALNTSLNFVMSDGERVYALSYATDEALEKRRKEAQAGSVGMEHYYDLYYARITSPERILVCSEKIPQIAGRENWGIVRNGELLAIDRHLHCECVRI